MLRQPFESGKITISRTHAILTYPATFILLAAMNPCPCGYADSNTHYCTCTPSQVQNYQNKISGPLRDRFDIRLTIKPVTLGREISKEEISSFVVKSRVEAARIRQYERYGKEICNSRVSYDILQKTSPLTKEQQKKIHQLSPKKDWSNRTQIKVIRLARTISDLEGKTAITDQSIWEAVNLH
ncbi:magnesium chelatase family protein [Bacillus niacini]|uniref:Magnesium chelatase family protein n=1 Tax=Neobacillus niacini TaxID=86668 RepID=A0A852T4H0_9BACI|nr:magnesium chelatase family protein [Neobacillus niacini]